jgi:Ca2+-dependent lipid-binding protein
VNKPLSLGSLMFNLKYCFEKNALFVTIIGASGLPPRKAHVTSERKHSDEQAGTNSVLDPYVKLQLLPEKEHKVKTRVMRNTTNPVYDEEFTFYGIDFNQLRSTTLHFAVVGFDRYSRDEIIGEVLCPLHSIDLTNSVQVPMTMDLSSKTAKFANQKNRGELLLSLSYLPAGQKLTVVVMKAKNLPQFDITGFADPYVKIYLHFNGQCIAKKKSHVKKRTLDPVWNESFTFDLPISDPKSIDDASLEVVVMDWDRVTRNEVMGRASIGFFAKSEMGSKHWDEIKKAPRKQIAEWHELQP